MKKLMLICAPVSSRSGYGDHARDLVRAFLKLDKFNVKIMDVNWGETPRDALDNKLDKNIIDCLLSEPKMDRQPDVYVDIRIPNEFQTIQDAVDAAVDGSTIILDDGNYSEYVEINKSITIGSKFLANSDSSHIYADAFSYNPKTRDFWSSFTFHMSNLRTNYFCFSSLYSETSLQII